MPSPGGQKHHHLGSTAIHPHWEPWECLTVERVCWISYRDFTTHSVKKWGFSLGLILPSMMGSKGRMWDPPGILRWNASYWLESSLCEKQYTCHFLTRSHISSNFRQFPSLLVQLKARCASRGSDGVSKRSLSEDARSGLTRKEASHASFFRQKKLFCKETLGNPCITWLPVLYYEGSG